MLHRQLEASPDALAVASYASASSIELQVTYAELWASAAQLSAHLRSIKVQRGDAVATCVHRSISMVSTIMGVLGADAAYVPVDPAYPLDRIEYMCENASVKVLCTDYQMEPILASIPLPKVICSSTSHSHTHYHSYLL